jgi:hypothetical protein
VAEYQKSGVNQDKKEESLSDDAFGGNLEF